MKSFRLSIALGALAALAACNNQPRQDTAEPDTAATGEPTDEPSQAPVSILRPEIDQPDLPEMTLEPLEALVGFPEGGAELDADAVAVLEGIIASEQFKQDFPVILRSHTDSAGTDEANQRASEERGLVVAAWLIRNGADEDRITVIPFGEQNPIEPNALPDGSPNEEGRAANRRVEIELPVVAPGSADVPEVAASEEGDAAE